jgi:hypothetical protein
MKPPACAAAAAAGASGVAWLLLLPLRGLIGLAAASCWLDTAGADTNINAGSVGPAGQVVEV